VRKPLAVERRDIIATTGPSVYGYKRMEKAISPQGKTYIFLGAREGEVYLELETKTPGAEPFIKIDSSEFARWKRKDM
jgi:hypothetical protein